MTILERNVVGSGVWYVKLCVFHQCSWAGLGCSALSLHLWSFTFPFIWIQPSSFPGVQSLPVWPCGHCWVCGWIWEAEGAKALQCSLPAGARSCSWAEALTMSWSWAGFWLFPLFPCCFLSPFLRSRGESFERGDSSTSPGQVEWL